MFTPVKLAVLLIAALSVAAMPSNIARNHREIAARVAQPEVVPVVQIAARDMTVPAKRLTRKKRAGTGRCQPNNSSDLPSPSSEPVSPKTSPGVNQEDNGPTSTPPQEDPKPTTTTTKQPDPTTTKQPDPTTTKPTPTPTPTPDPGNGGGDTYTGQGTFYSTGLGACGITNNDGEDIAAVSHLFFDTFPDYTGGNPNKNPMCNKTAKVTYKGKTIYVKLTDRCEGCAYGDLDFSPHAFNQLADPAEGRISGISWQIVD